MSVDEPSVPSDAEDAMDEMSPKTPSELATSVRLCVCVRSKILSIYTQTHTNSSDLCGQSFEIVTIVDLFCRKKWTSVKTL